MSPQTKRYLENIEEYKEELKNSFDDLFTTGRSVIKITEGEVKAIRPWEDEYNKELEKIAKEITDAHWEEYFNINKL